jgi:hypothetical protein
MAANTGRVNDQQIDILLEDLVGQHGLFVSV